MSTSSLSSLTSSDVAVIIPAYNEVGRVRRVLTVLQQVEWLTAQTRGRLIPGLDYRILIKLPDGQTWRVTWPARAKRLDRRSFRTHLNLAQVGYPPVLGFAVEVVQQTTLDRTGWHFVILQAAP
jgi:hypothetical protein